MNRGIPLKLVLMAAAPLLLFAATNASAAGICTVVVDAVTMYHSEPFEYALPAGEDPLFADLSDTTQARDFEAHVRRMYGAGGEISRHCRVAADDEAREDGTMTFNGVTFRHVQTGYVPQG